MEESEFKEKTRKLIFDSELRNFPTLFEMYVRTFHLDVVDLDKCMGEILSIITTSERVEVGYSMVCHYLDGLE